jgi:glycosyltransferase involved in cell wall biosynthesis
MKIIRLCTFLDYGGVEKRLINISHIEDSNEWIFCSLNKGGFAQKVITEKGKRVVCLGSGYKIPNLFTIFKLIYFFRKEKPDVVHTSGAEANFHGILAARFAFVPMIIAEEIGIPSQKRIAKYIFKYIYRLSNFVIGNSKLVIKYLIDENQINPKKTRLIPNPLIFNELPKSIIKNKDKFSLVSVSRVEPVKNIEAIINVIYKLKKKYAIEYLIIGDGSQIKYLKNLTSRLNLEANIIFLGFIEDPIEYLMQSDLFVLNSFSEGFSNSLIEAMYCGIPVISTRVGAAEDIIDDGKNGWLIAPDSESELFRTIKGIFELSSEKRNKVGLNGRNKVVQEYSLKRHTEQLIDIYSS